MSQYTPLAAVDPSIFRAYDVRGVVGSTLNESIVYQIGLAIGSEATARGQKTVVVGRDGRLSGPSLSTALMDGLRAAGQDVVDVGMVPTPTLYFATYHLGFPSGVMVTGSHNPADYNGFKIVLAGETLSGDQITDLYRRIAEKDFSQGEGSYRAVSIDDDYVNRITGDVKLAKPMKVVVDCGNGVTGELGPRLAKALGCEIIPLFTEIDGNFPNHHPDPGKLKNLQDCIKAVKEHGADLGLAFDGDGDRVGVITNAGHVVFPDRLMMLFAQDVCGRNPDAQIIYDVKCSRLLAPAISKAGGKPMMWKTGHSLIKAKMKESGALLAGEMSGHIFFKERWYGFDDGLYSACRLLEILSNADCDADTLFKRFPEDVSTPEINIEVTDTGKFTIVEALQKLDFPGGDKSTIDGVRVDFPDGWGLIRASNTTPVLVLRFEAETTEALERIRSLFQARLNEVDGSLVIPHE
ncbi:phosphomannomutase/phosphoglucomutase [Pokkaliibacter plantistimulans]|uniref:Phosphomannomutase/phosphoglucomutase n=1 Tax=Proteobacteria bacterium 228 TaxID=2083153 RepID=A0A2S5KRI0_9PROT|nr:phosphomannomutase/phosphoglucomutase [Pokkaliibacter plantistimulans]PPC77467.1 phosphomannomutase/phosphoglucomutase [Pokkaliibacter plantistimulans]